MNATLLEIMAASVVRRIAIPRKLAGKVTRHGSLNAKMWNELNPHDKDDIRQSVALAVILAGLPNKPVFVRAEKAECKAVFAQYLEGLAGLSGRVNPKMEAKTLQASESATLAARAAIRAIPFSVWRVAFIAARKTLLMGNRAGENRQTYLDPRPVQDGETNPRLDLNEFSCPDTDADTEANRRDKIARKVRYLRACIGATYKADLSPKRKAGRAGAARFLRWLTAFASGQGFGRFEYSTRTPSRADKEKAASALRVAKLRFVKYVAKGESLLTLDSISGVERVRTFNSLAAIPSGGLSLAPDASEPEPEDSEPADFVSFSLAPEPAPVPLAPAPVETVDITLPQAQDVGAGFTLVNGRIVRTFLCKVPPAPVPVSRPRLTDYACFLVETTH